jgi:hypothetical protein
VTEVRSELDLMSGRRRRAAAANVDRTDARKLPASTERDDPFPAR